MLEDMDEWMAGELDGQTTTKTKQKPGRGPHLVNATELDCWVI